MNAFKVATWLGLSTFLASPVAIADAMATLAPTPASTALIRAADLQADAAILRRAFTALHPGLYRYNTPAQMDQAFRVLERSFQRDNTLAEAYLALSVFAAKIECGHTYANFYNQKKSVQQALFSAGRVPFYFRWLDQRMIVTQSFADHPHLQPGTEVLAINGTPAAVILARLMTVARADGANNAKRRAYLEVQGKDRFEAFDVYFPLFFPSTAPRMTLRLRNPTTRRTIVVDVQMQTAEQRLAAMPGAGATQGADDPVFEFRMLDDQVGYLRMPTWALYDSKWDWKAFLATTFGTLASNGATDLVIDVRGNEGGNDVGDDIVSHLIAAPVPRQAVQRLVRYRSVPLELEPYLDTWDPSFKNWGDSAISAADGFYRLRRDADDDVGSLIKPALPRFSGRAWVLVGATNSSATFEFADVMQRNRLGKLVGQPTGGNRRGINGGAFFFLRLPNSGLEIDLPLIGLFPRAPQPNQGLLPDIPVALDSRAIARGRDSELEQVLARIRRLRR